MVDRFLNIWRKRHVKEDFYKRKVAESLKELDEIFVSMRSNQIEIEKSKKETKAILLRIENEMLKFERRLPASDKKDEK
jgi:hypothetical protein